ncbi:hypothetical protein [Streptomyces bobili]|uniref:hypothetical protein n=1 Tax=Streptomyces bobili TaxID=67280 RepID=UPI003811A9CF
MTDVDYELSGLEWKLTAYWEKSASQYQASVYVSELLEQLAKTNWWPRLEYVGHSFWDMHERRDRTTFSPMQTLEDLQKVTAGAHGTFTLTQGGAREAVYTMESEAFFTFDQRKDFLEVKAGASSTTLADMKERSLDDIIDLVCALKRARPEIRVSHASAAPFGPLFFNDRKPPAVHRPLHAVVDIFDPQASEEERALAHAPTPPTVRRRERDGLTILSWVNDPSCWDQTRAAAAHHERWMTRWVRPFVADGWQGELWRAEMSRIVQHG